MAEHQEPTLASLSLTHVHYNPNDPISFLCAWLALLPQALCVVYVTLIWSSREVEIAMTFAGQLACEALNWGLKRYIKEERPKQMNGKGYGMPSSHAQFMAFWAVYLTLFLLVRHGPASHVNPTKRTNSASLQSHVSFSIRLLLSTAGGFIAAAVAQSRIYLNYHTPLQVAVGAGAGAAFGVLWFIVVAVVRQSGLLGWALSLPIARWGRWRDLSVRMDLAQTGWEVWEAQNGSLKPSGQEHLDGLIPDRKICKETFRKSLPWWIGMFLYVEVPEEIQDTEERWGYILRNTDSYKDMAGAFLEEELPTIENRASSIEAPDSKQKTASLMTDDFPTFDMMDPETWRCRGKVEAEAFQLKRDIGYLKGEPGSPPARYIMEQIRKRRGDAFVKEHLVLIRLPDDTLSGNIDNGGDKRRWL